MERGHTQFRHLKLQQKQLALSIILLTLPRDVIDNEWTVLNINNGEYTRLKSSEC